MAVFHKFIINLIYALFRLTICITLDFSIFNCHYILKTRLYLLLLALLVCNIAKSQLQGTITTTDGDTLSYASVYVEGTTNGTIANGDGYYNLVLDPGDYSIVYQYIGYEKLIKEITISDDLLDIDVSLEESSYVFNDVVIAADAEDPAYAIIRKAIKAREANGNLINSYTADIYVKGVVKMVDTPESFLGQDIGDLGGVLDSTGQGILYLSESQSKIWYEKPNKVKEEMISSVVSGSDNGINANQFNNGGFDFYSNTQEFSRSMVTPIADNALTYYRYKLLGTTYDNDGTLINKIKVIPKSQYSPTFSGTIYIYEDQWNIHSVDLKFTGKAIKQKIFDTIRVQQIFVPLEGYEGHPMKSQIMTFEASLFGFDVEGDFSYILSNYDLNIKHPEGTFGKEIFKMNKDAAVNDSSFWEEVRPIPLTNEEKIDYVRKDSLKRLWESKPYLDSLDKANNKFKVTDILFGYDFQNSFKKRFFTYKSPLSSLQFNAVEGYVISANFEARLYDSTENKQLRLKPTFRYGFSDNQIKGGLDIRYRFDRLNRGFLSLAAGRDYTQMDRRNPAMVNINTYYSLFSKKNLLNLYERKYAKASIFKEIFNGIYSQLGFNYEDRNSLENTSSQSWTDSEDAYRPNNLVEVPEIGEYLISIPDHQTLSLNARIVWRPGQKYLSFPDYKRRVQSGAPTFELIYNHGLLDTDYSKIRLNISDNRVNTKLLGYSVYTLESGIFLTDNRIEFPDLFHFMGNETSIGFTSKYLSAFKLMQPYSYTTSDKYAVAFFEHHFDGFILDRVPLLRNLGAKLIAGANYLKIPERHYLEYSIGLDNIGIGPFTLFRMDYAWARGDAGLRDHGFMLGLVQIFED